MLTEDEEVYFEEGGLRTYFGRFWFFILHLEIPAKQLHFQETPQNLLDQR